MLLPTDWSWRFQLSVGGADLRRKVKCLQCSVNSQFAPSVFSDSARCLHLVLRSPERCDANLAVVSCRLLVKMSQPITVSDHWTHYTGHQRWRTRQVGMIGGLSGRFASGAPWTTSCTGPSQISLFEDGFDTEDVWTEVSLGFLFPSVRPAP